MLLSVGWEGDCDGSHLVPAARGARVPLERMIRPPVFAGVARGSSLWMRFADGLSRRRIKSLNAGRRKLPGSVRQAGVPAARFFFDQAAGRSACWNGLVRLWCIGFFRCVAKAKKERTLP